MLKESVNGSKYLKITESRRDPEGEFEHSRVMVYEEHADQFLRSVRRAVHFVTEGGKADTSLERIRRQYPNAYARWSDEDDRLLGATFRQGKAIAELAAQLACNWGPLSPVCANWGGSRQQSLELWSMKDEATLRIDEYEDGWLASCADSPRSA